MMGAPVRKEILATQMSVVRNEYEASENSSHGVLSKRIMAAAFEWHSDGKTTIGAARRLEESRAYARISRNYRKTAAANQTIETPDKANAMFTAGMPMNVRHAHRDYAALTLANYRLGGHSTARLYVRIRGKDGLSYSVNSMLPADAKDPRADWMVFAIANRINVAKLQTALQDEMVKAVKASPRTNGPTPRKAGCNRATSSDRTMALPPSASYPTSAKAAPWPSTWNWKEVSALTVAEVNDGWRRHMDFSQLSIIPAGDFKKAAAAPGR